MPRVLVVLPTYNEAQNIAAVLGRIREALPEASILVVDDGSPDGTADLAEEMADKLGNIEILRREGKGGLGSAYRAGFRWGLMHGWEVLVEMDADLSHDPGALPDLIAPIAQGADLVIGSRYMPGGSIPHWSWHRRLLSEGGNRYAAALLGLGVHDSTSGFRAYRARILGQLDLDRIKLDGYGFQVEMTYRVRQHGGAVLEVPIRFVDRVEGESKMSLHIVVEALLKVTWWGVERFGRRITRRTPVGS
jgi:dolichol-phosphate mannosyltransferase